MEHLPVFTLPGIIILTKMHVKVMEKQYNISFDVHKIYILPEMKP